MGGPSGPMLLCQFAAIGHKSIGPEGPPTKAPPRLSGAEKSCGCFVPASPAPVRSGFTSAF
ncbi:DUF6053 domain-containing protein [Lysobacter enzymogenes]|uniref:DUF6053 domain-containing protein n=1 Tax=Lysobacter enzymogenes TaxID=69 RepID=UPI003D18F0BD